MGLSEPSASVTAAILYPLDRSDWVLLGGDRRGSDWERGVWSEFLRLLCSGSGGSSEMDRRRKSGSSVVGFDPSILSQSRGA